MNEAIENVVSRNDDQTLRGRCAHAHRPCKDSGDVVSRALPPTPPGDFTVVIGAVLAGRPMERLRAEMAALGGFEEAVSLLLFEWVEVEVWGFPDLVEELMRLRGQVMALGSAMVGTW